MAFFYCGMYVLHVFFDVRTDLIPITHQMPYVSPERIPGAVGKKGRRETNMVILAGGPAIAYTRVQDENCDRNSPLSYRHCVSEKAFFFVNYSKPSATDK